MDNTVKIGDRRVHRLGFGAMRITGEGIWGEPDDRDNAIEVLRKAVELGVDFFDTADAYGPEASENLIREALAPYDGLLIATKGGMTRRGPGEWATDGRPEHIKEACEGSLKRLGLKQIELYQFHRPDPNVPFEESLQAFIDLKEQAKVKHIGLSNVTAEQLRTALHMTEIVSVQNNYNVTNRASEDVLKLCEDNDIAFIPYFPVGGNTGGFTQETLELIAKKHDATVQQVALKWLLQHSPVMLPIPGTSSIDHLEENVAAAGVELDEEDVAELDKLS